MLKMHLVDPETPKFLARWLSNAGGIFKIIISSVDAMLLEMKMYISK